MGLLRKARAVYRDDGFMDLFRRSVRFLADDPRYVHYSLTNALFHLQYGEGADVMAEDWDTLVILDACRYDSFERCNDLAGDLQKRISRGSSSLEFIGENFVGGEFHDTVYVTANTYYNMIGEDVFHAVVSCLNEWDPDLQTIPPDSVAETAVQAHEEYPHKRLIVHFMQPHAPYIGDIGREFQQRIQTQLEVKGMNVERGFRGWDTDFDGDVNPNAIHPVKAPTVDGLKLTDDDLIAAYEDNLKVVLSHVRDLLNQLDGKSVITADHGEMLGDRVFPLPRKRYGHHTYLHTRSLCVVPWFITESGQRRRVTSDRPVRYDSTDQDELEAKLQALGYR